MGSNRSQGHIEHTCRNLGYLEHQRLIGLTLISSVQRHYEPISASTWVNAHFAALHRQVALVVVFSYSIHPIYASVSATAFGMSPLSFSCSLHPVPRLQLAFSIDLDSQISISFDSDSQSCASTVRLTTSVFQSQIHFQFQLHLALSACSLCFTFGQTLGSSLSIYFSISLRSYFSLIRLCALRPHLVTASLRHLSSSA